METEEGQGVGNGSPEEAPTPEATTDEVNTTEETVTPEAEPQPEQKEIDLAEKFNEVTGREKALRDNEERIKAERDAHTTIQFELEAANKIMADFKANPLEGLKSLGIDFKDVAEMVLNEDKPTPEHRVRKLEEQIQKRDDDAKAKEEADAQAQTESQQKFAAEEQERLISDAKESIKQEVDGNEDKYEFIRTQDAYDLVFEVAAQVYNETKNILTWEEAAGKVEEQLWADHLKIAGTKKFKDKYQDVPPKISHDDERDIEANYYGRQHINDLYGRSLSNQMASEGSKAPEKSDYRTDEESKEYLAAKLRKIMEA